MILHKLTPFQNVAASVTAVHPNLPLGMTYLGILLQRGGTTFTNAHLANIRISLDSKRIWDITGPHLLAQNNYHMSNLLDWLVSHVHVENDSGGPTDAPTAYSSQYDLIPFADFNARTVGGEMLGAIDTSVGYRSFSMEIDLGAATAPTLNAWAILGPPKAANDPNKLTIRTLLKRIESPAAAGEYNLEVPTGSRAGALIHRTFLHNTYVTKLQVLKDGLYLLQEGESALLSFLQAIKHRNPQSGLTVYDPSPNDNQSESVSTLRSNGQVANFEFKGTVSQADTITIYNSLYATLDRI